MGMINHCTFIHDVKRLQNGDYRKFGFYVALAIIFGIPGPRYFLPCVVQKILDLAVDDQPKMEDIPPIDVIEKLQEICRAEDADEF